MNAIRAFFSTLLFFAIIQVTELRSEEPAKKTAEENAVVNSANQGEGSISDKSEIAVPCVIPNSNECAAVLMPICPVSPVASLIQAPRFTLGASIFRFGFPSRVTAESIDARVVVQPTGFRLYDERNAVARANNAMITESKENSPTLPGIVFQTSFLGQELNSGLNAKGRVDVISESRLAGNSGTDFVVANIPVQGQDFAASGWQSNVLVNATTVDFDTRALTPLGNLRAFYQNDFANELDVRQRTQYHLRHLYAQLQNVGIGKTTSAFSDIDARPDTADRRGPNGRMYNLTERVWVQMPLPLFEQGDRALSSELSIEDPDAQISIPDNLMGALAASRAPDVASSLVFTDSWIKAKFASVGRLMGLETPDGAFRENVYGWGVKFSSVLTPFPPESPFGRDTLYTSVSYGEGIARYNYDLQELKNSDAAIGPNGNLQSLPLFTYFVGATHYWTDRLRSTAVYSEVRLDSVASLGEFAYRNGRYASANVAYVFPGDKIQVGFEYLYGQKETHNGNLGDESRLQLVLAFAAKE